MAYFLAQLEDHLSKTDFPFRLCKIVLRNTLLIFGRKNCRLLFSGNTLSDFGLLYKLALVTLSIILKGSTALQTSGSFENPKNQICPYGHQKLYYVPKINLKNVNILRPLGLRASSLEALGLRDTIPKACHNQCSNSQAGAKN